MHIHKFNPGAADQRLCVAYPYDGNASDMLCLGTEMAEQHQRIESALPWYPTTTVKLSDSKHIVHLGDMLWNRQANGDWYSAWFKEHTADRPVRKEQFDCWTAQEVGKFIGRLMSGYYSDMELIDMGMMKSYA